MSRYSRFAYGLVVALLITANVSAKEVDYGIVKRLTRAGAYNIDLRGKGTFRVPSDFRFVSEDKLPEFAQLLDLPVYEDEIAAILPDDCRWVCMITVLKSNPMKGQDPKQLDKDALLAWQQEYATRRKPRSGLGIPSKVVGWTHQPVYDEDKKQLVMGVRLTPDKGESGTDVVRHQHIIYSESGEYCCIEIVASISGWAKPVNEYSKLAAEFTFIEPVAEEVGSEVKSSDYLKIGISGLVGTLAVAFVFRTLTSRRPAPVRSTPTRRPGLPR